MILNQDTVEFEKGGTFAREKAFGVKLGPKIFKMLSSDVYTNKIQAVIRELSHNARDIHIFAGRAYLPFDVHMPNDMDPTFYIRDYGTGLSESDIEHIMFNIGHSTKETTNDLVGCFGIGSKSPFAYTDSFLVTSWHDGYCKEYSCYINEKGFPHVVRLSSVKTTEQTGLMVKMSVQEDDFEAFQKEAKHVFKHFPVKPNILGMELKIPSREYVYKDEHFGLYEVKDEGTRRWGYSQPKTFSAIQGYVEYPVDLNSMHLKDKQFEIQMLLNIKYGVDLFFELGQVNIAPSREALDMNDSTKAAMLDKFLKVIPKFQEYVQSLIKDAKNDWEKAIAFKKIKNDIFVNSHGNDISRLLGNIKIERALDMKLPEWDWMEKVRFQSEGTRYADGWSADEKNTKGSRFTVQLGSDIKFVLIDTFRATSQIYEMAKRGVYLIFVKRLETEKSDKNIFFRRIRSGAYKKQLANHFGCDESLIIYAEDLDWPKLVVKSNTPKNDEAFEMNASVTAFYKKQIDYNKGGIYVEFNTGVPENAVVGYYAREWEKLGTFEMNKGQKLYGVPKRNMKLIADNPKWIKLDVFAKTMFQAAYDNFSMAHIETLNVIKTADFVDNLGCGSYVAKLMATHNFPRLTLPADFNKLVDFFRDHRRDALRHDETERQRVKYLVRHLGERGFDVKKLYQLNDTDFVKETMKKYRLFFAVDLSNKELLDSALEYVTLKGK